MRFSEYIKPISRSDISSDRRHRSERLFLKKKSDKKKWKEKGKGEKVDIYEAKVSLGVAHPKPGFKEDCFVYIPGEGLLYQDIESNSIYLNKKKISEIHEPHGVSLAHGYLLRYIKPKIAWKEVSNYIRGRLSEDRKHIIFWAHRDTIGMDRKRFDYLKNRAVAAIYKYMRPE